MSWNDLPLEVKQMIMQQVVDDEVHRIVTRKHKFWGQASDLLYLTQVSYALSRDLSLVALQSAAARLKSQTDVAAAARDAFFAAERVPRMCGRQSHTHIVVR